MTTKYFQHMTNSSLGIGVVIDNTAWAYSNYYNAKWNLTSIQAEEEAFRKMNSSFIPSSLNDVLAKTFAESKAKIEVFKEWYFDTFRQQHHLELPSRTKCIFLFEDNIDVKPIVQSWGHKGQKNISILKMIDGKTHYADPHFLNCNTAPLSEWQSTFAPGYWQGLKSDYFKSFEILAIGQFEVISSQTVHL